MRLTSLLLIVLALAVPIAGQERITLAASESISSYRIAIFSVVSDDPDTAALDEGQLIIDLRAPGVSNVCRYTADTNPTGTFLNTALNKANLSTVYAGNATTGSLKQRVCHRLVVMGESAAVCARPITGSCTGAVP